MSESPIFIMNAGYRLYAMLHAPDNSAVPGPLKGLGVVFCHPFAEEKLIAHRTMVNLARSLTAQGVTCLRFDEMGHGDSGGNFEDSTIETRLSDIRCAVDHLREHGSVRRIGLIGLRFGATLAALACTGRKTIDFLVMISPVADGRQYIEQCLRSNLTTQMTTYGKIVKDRKALIDDIRMGGMVNIDGYLFSSSLYEQMEKVNLLDRSDEYPEKTLIVHIAGQGTQAPETGIAALLARTRSTGSPIEFTTVSDAQCWKDLKTYQPKLVEVQKTVIQWLGAHGTIADGENKYMGTTMG